MSQTASPAERAWSAIVEYARSFAPPEGGFDPGGAWAHEYLIWDPTSPGIGRAPRAPTEKSMLRIERRPQGPLAAAMRVVETMGLGPRAMAVVATIEYAADEVASLVSWHMTARFLEGQQELANLTADEAGRARDGVIEWKRTNGAAARTVAMAAPVTSNWTLFDAVQRLARVDNAVPDGGDPPAGPRFDMLEDLKLPRRNQRLVRRGRLEVELGGQTRRLVCYCQLGEGILPIHYFLDGNCRLLFAVGQARAYVLRQVIAPNLAIDATTGATRGRPGRGPDAKP